MCAKNSWLYFDIEDTIDMDITIFIEEEEQKMTEQTLLRLAMILQNQAPTTLNKYIAKLAETILLDFQDGATLFELSSSLNAQFNLAFTEEEVKQTITKRDKAI